MTHKRIDAPNRERGAHLARNLPGGRVITGDGRIIGARSGSGSSRSSLAVQGSATGGAVTGTYPDQVRDITWTWTVDTNCALVINGTAIRQQIARLDGVPVTITQEADGSFSYVGAGLGPGTHTLSITVTDRCRTTVTHQIAFTWSADLGLNLVMTAGKSCAGADTVVTVTADAPYAAATIAHVSNSGDATSAATGVVVGGSGTSALTVSYAGLLAEDSHSETIVVDVTCGGDTEQVSIEATFTGCAINVYEATGTDLEVYIAKYNPGNYADAQGFIGIYEALFYNPSTTGFKNLLVDSGGALYSYGAGWEGLETRSRVAPQEMSIYLDISDMWSAYGTSKTWRLRKRAGALPDYPGGFNHGSLVEVGGQQYPIGFGGEDVADGQYFAQIDFVRGATVGQSIVRVTFGLGAIV